jgi:hypothetical protein
MEYVNKFVLLPIDKFERLSSQKDDGIDSAGSAITSENLETPAADKNTSVSSSTGQRVDSLSEDDIISSVPKKFRTRAKGLLNHLVHDGIIRWDAKGEVTLDGDVVKGSHVTDLLKDTQTTYKRFSPIGRERLKDVLRSRNMPLSLIGNKYYVDPPIAPTSIHRNVVTKPKIQKKSIKWDKL